MVCVCEILNYQLYDIQKYMGCSKFLSRLYFRKDKKMYIACYEELAKKLPGPPTSLILGDAYMNIQEVSSTPAH